MTPPGVRPDRPGPGQESVWDYPRPPRVEATTEVVVVTLGGLDVVRSTRALRVLETSHPPVYYLPVADVLPGVLRATTGTSFCEFKGTATYLDLVAGGRTAARAGWTYPNPARGFESLRDHVALYPALMERVTVDGEIVRPQEGGFYGGWITDRVVGPFKGPAGTQGW